METSYHIPVLLKEAVDGLNVKPDGVYVDCTLGGGSHSNAILGKLNSKGKLFAFDKDMDAKKNVPADSRIIFIQQNFRYLQRFLRLHNINAVDGILADLGVSSHQLDEPQRGFSTRFKSTLDMRMDQQQTLKASDVVNTYSEQQLHKLFERYGEVTNAKTLAKTIVDARRSRPLQTTEDLQNAIRRIVKGSPDKYFAQVFQALRIEVNDELVALKELLQQVPSLLKPGGRVVIITFHSLEDRLVKNFFRNSTFDEPEQNPFMTEEKVKELNVITKKPILPSKEEIKQNPRARSAKLRIAERIMMA